MNYWLLTTEYPPFYGGGISTYCYFTAKMMAEKGYQVSVFLPDNSISNIKIEKGEVRVIRFNPTRSKAAAYLGYITCLSYEFAQLVKDFILNEGAPDFIEAQDYLGVAYYLLQYKHLLYSWCSQVPIIITLHSPAFLYLEYNHVNTYQYPEYWIGEMERYSLQAADLVISPSQYLIQTVLKKFTLSHNNIAHLPNPFDFEKEISKEGKSEQIIFFGKLSVQKGIFPLLRYFKQAWDSGFNQPLYLIGGQDIVYHPEKITMGHWVKKHYKKYIANGLLQLQDKISPDKIKSRLSNAKVIIVPSNVDNLPYVVLEAMSLGKVVFVSKQGGQAEVIEDGVNGFVFDHENPETFGDKLFKILSLTQEERKIIEANAIDCIKEGYHFDKIYAQKIQLLNGLKNEKVFKKVYPFIRQPRKVIVESSFTAYTKGLLSVVVPYYNMGKYIEETIASLLNTDYAPKEIIIVNDGSTDKDSIDKLNQYRNIKGFHVIDKNNSGLANTRNVGAEYASGEYLAFLDADDKVGKRYYSKALQVLNFYTNVFFVGCWTKYFEGSQKVWPTFQPEPPLILYHNVVNSSALVYKRSAFLAAGKNDSGMLFTGLEDYESVVNLLDNGYNGVVLPEVLFYYRVTKSSMIRSITKGKKELLHQYIREKHKDFYASFASDVISLTHANGAGTLIDNPSLDYNLVSSFPFINKLVKKGAFLIKSNWYAKAVAYQLFKLINK